MYTFDISYSDKSNASPIVVQDMFYISPFYHLVFQFEKFLVTDADIEFRYNINLLYSEFDKFGEDKLFAFAKDMSPLYRTLLFNYRYIIWDYW